MAKRQTEERAEWERARAGVNRVSDLLIEYAERKAELEPVMLRLARAGGMKLAEKHILRLRKIVATRKAG